jgi:hypothetical protein
MKFIVSSSSWRGGTPSYFGDTGLEPQPWDLLSSVKYSGFTQCLHPTVGTVPRIKTRPLLATSFPINYSPIIFRRYIVWATDSGGMRYYATSREVAGAIPDEVIEFFSWPNPSSRTMALWSAQPLSEMSTMNLRASKRRPARKADLTATCKPIV